MIYFVDCLLGEVARETIHAPFLCYKGFTYIIKKTLTDKKYFVIIVLAW